MSTPIACSLDPGAYRARIDDLSALAARALLARTPTEGGERFTFRDDESVEAQLRAAIAAEATCCTFLKMELERRDGTLVLDVTAPEEARQVIAELFA